MFSGTISKTWVGDGSGNVALISMVSFETVFSIRVSPSCLTNPSISVAIRVSARTLDPCRVKTVDSTGGVGVGIGGSGVGAAPGLAAGGWEKMKHEVPIRLLVGRRPKQPNDYGPAAPPRRRSPNI